MNTDTTWYKGPLIVRFFMYKNQKITCDPPIRFIAYTDRLRNEDVAVNDDLDLRVTTSSKKNLLFATKIALAKLLDELLSTPDDKLSIQQMDAKRHLFSHLKTLQRNALSSARA